MSSEGEVVQKLEQLTVEDQEEEQGNQKSRFPKISDEERRRIWEENQALKPVLERGVAGKVKWYSVKRCYGFIARDDEKDKDVFVHQSVIAKSPINKYFLRTLADGEEVLFDIVEGEKGPEASNVTGPEGAEVKGSRYFHFLLRRRQSKKPSPKKEEGNTVEKEGETKKKRKPFNKRNNTRRNRKEKKSAEIEEGVEAIEDGEEDDAKVATKRVSEDEKKQTKIGEGAGDVGLGSQTAPVAAVH